MGCRGFRSLGFLLLVFDIAVDDISAHISYGADVITGVPKMASHPSLQGGEFLEQPQGRDALYPFDYLGNRYVRSRGYKQMHMVGAGFRGSYLETLCCGELQENCFQIVLDFAGQYLSAVFCAKDDMVANLEYNSSMVNGLHVMRI
jgi:hypothetical protein